MNTNNTKFPNSTMPQFNKVGVHMPPVYRVVKPSELPAETATVDEEGLEYPDVYPLQFISSSFSHNDVSNNKQAAASSSTFVLNDYIKKP
jgi:hypothetical protein